ncbi:hypothetical protein QBC38DRAFT_460520 [Podospora fimiseda]|uniref:Uncharacterized protein n=1 Tax=Podospora fimiseda TaxID=252190 RepID=A0AAN6YSU0_9PEZI|nr:hypothetical protein QBC38DRAFT_460520 [Podospora fimiseda]
MYSHPYPGFVLSNSYITVHSHDCPCEICVATRSGTEIWISSSPSSSTPTITYCSSSRAEVAWSTYWNSNCSTPCHHHHCHHHVGRSDQVTTTTTSPVTETHYHYYYNYPCSSSKTTIPSSSSATNLVQEVTKKAKPISSTSCSRSTQTIIYTPASTRPCTPVSTPSRPSSPPPSAPVPATNTATDKTEKTKDTSPRTNINIKYIHFPGFGVRKKRKLPLTGYAETDSSNSEDGGKGDGKEGKEADGGKEDSGKGDDKKGDGGKSDDKKGDGGKSDDKKGDGGKGDGKKEDGYDDNNASTKGDYTGKD